MPNFDGTGPTGQGARTGRGRGCCLPGQGRGFGRGGGMGAGTGRGQSGGLGCGRGTGFQRMFWTDQDWKESLQSYQQQLERELEAVKQEIADLE